MIKVETHGNIGVHLKHKEQQKDSLLMQKQKKITSILIKGNSMPTYSYEHKEDDGTCYSLIFDLVQPITEDALKECPKCLKPVKRIITSAPSFKMAGGTPKFHG